MSSILFRRSCLAVLVAAVALFACGSDEKDPEPSSSETGGGSSDDDDDAAADDDDDNDASSGGSQSGGTGGASNGTGGSPVDVDIAPIIINELMPSNSTTISDAAGAFPDWIELYNPTDKDVDLGGYYVSDSDDEPTRYALPKGLVIKANGYRLLWADGDLDEGPEHLPFKLAADKEAALVSGPDGALLDSVKYESAQQDRALARFPDAIGEFAWCAEATPGEANPDECASGSIPLSQGGAGSV